VKRNTLYIVAALVMVLSFMLSACQPAATPTAAPVATQPAAAQPTQPQAAQPTTPPAAAFQPMSVVAPDCNYGTADNPAKLKSIEAVDQYTVKFTLCMPDPAFASKVAFSVFSITSKDNLDKYAGDSVKMSDAPDGTGPYMLKEWVRGDHITFVANPNYWGTPALAKTVIFKWAEQPAQRLLEVQSGTADGFDNPAPEDFATIQADPNLKVYERGPLNVFYVGFQVDMKPFDNEKIRQAFAQAIDSKRIVDNFYPAGSLVATQFDPPAIEPGFTKGASWYPYDANAAKQALTAAGFDFNQELQLSFRNVSRAYLPNPKQVAQEIQAELAQIGVKVKLNEMESGAFLDAANAGQLPFYLLGWNADYPDATDFLDYHFANANNKQFGTEFPDLVAEISAAAKLSDPAARQAHYDKANDLVKQHVPMVPVAHGASATVFKAGVDGAHASPLGNEVFSVMKPVANDTIVWVQSGEPLSLWCNDEDDGETLRACEQMYDALLSYKVGGVEVQAGLAQTWEANTDATEWTFHLRQGVKFFSGKVLDANDVVATYAAIWDAKNPDHKGRTGDFYYFGAFFGPFLNSQ
jgi:peptide/nickel transport system substrate-binding protein